MGSCGNLASASEPPCSDSEVAEGSVSEKLTGIKAALDSHDSNANAGQMRSSQATRHSGIEGDCSPGHCDKTSLVVGRGGQCTGKGGFECENLSESDASYLDREVLFGEICLGNVQNTDDMALKLISGIGCLDNPSDQIEAEDGTCGAGSLLKGVNLVEKTADGLLDVEDGTKLIPSSIITGDVCRNVTEATLESKVITEVVKGQDSHVINDQKGSCPPETCANSMDEKVNDVAVVETNICDVRPCSETSEMPSKNVLSSGYPDERSTTHGNRNVSGLQIEAVEALYVVDMGNCKLASDETDVAADHSCPTDSLFHAVRETIQEDDRSAKCLSLREAVTKVEAETCIEALSFQITEMPVEEKTVLPLNHGKASDNNDTMTVNSLINETNLGDMIEADSRNDGSIFLPHKTPYEQSRMPDCKTDSDQLNEQRSGGPLSGMSAETSGTEDVKNDDMSCQTLPSTDNQGTSEGLHISSLFSNSAQVDGRVDSNGAPETYVVCVEENARPPDKFNDSGSQALQLKEVTFNFERLSEETLGLHSCEPHSTVKDCSAKSSDDLDVPSVIVAAATTSSAANDYLNEKNDESKHDGRSECVPEIESPVVITSSSRSSRLNKSGRKTQAKRASRYSRNGSKVAPNYEALELIFKASKKKRTCCSKTRRSSTWGVMQSVSQHFEHMYELGIESAQKQGSRKVRVGQGIGKQSRNQTGGTTQASKGKVGGSSNRIRLKVKMGKEVVLISEVHTPASMSAFAPASCGGTSSDVANLTNDVKEKNQLDCLDAMLDIGKSYHGNSLVNGDPNSRAKDSAQDVRGCFDPTPVEIGHVRTTFEDGYLGSETSPDSEVIDLMPEAQIGGRHQQGLNSVALDSSKSPATSKDVLDTRKGKKKDKVPRQINYVRKDKSLSGSSSSKRRGSKVKVGGSFNSGENAALFTGASRLTDSSRNTESLNLSSESDLAFFNGSLSVDSGANTKAGQDICIGSMALEHSNNDLPSYAKKKGQKQVKSSKSGGVSGARSRGVNSTKSRKGATCKQNKDSEKSTRKSKVKEKGIYNHFLCKAEDRALAGNGGIDGDKKSKTAACMWTDVTSKSEIISNNLVEQQPPHRNAWVRCDDCHKWRRIAAALADSLEDANCNWTCKDNLDKSFADCSIPQEMSNADINAELELSDYSCEDDDYDGSRNYKELKCGRPAVSQQSSFIQIETNKFLHRSRRTQTIDEVMVCHCKPPSDGKLGCGDECLNRVLNIECVQGTCPCGDLCSNQQFQKRKYANLQWFRCGKKGYGLQLLEDVSKGDFIIEYVGEVLDIPTYEERQRDYAVKGHKHFYFMTLNGGEVIDACNKGNLGRFINHSCDPNCQTEKWMVNGEICIGLFAIRDIKKGEEVTFDYNYVRVFGAAAKKCVCGSAQCRGYIGGDLQSTETIFQGDSDDEFPEPVMLHEDGDVAYRFDNAIPQNVGGSDILVVDQTLKDRSEVIGKLEKTLGHKGLQSQSVSCISHSDRSSDAEGILEKALQSKPSQELSVHSEDAVITPLPELQRKISIEEDSSNVYHTFTQEMNEPPGRSVSDEKGGLAEVHPLGKILKSSNTVKKSKGSSNLQNPNKGQGMAKVFIKPKKAIEGSSNGRFEAVQEKLNELLDADGGISKRKDAAKGYLKLLLLTAASGDSVNGEAIQSNRDLSMILDAILKTRSRIVLMDIINKNGLRMLHNIMKQYRRDFKKIPILRKLLKVLEYLAVREILTLEHINVGPPCPGMESFRESILSLTEHDDKQVHQIARSFRDRWIPRHLRKVGYADRDDGMNRGLNFNSVGSQSNWQDAGQTRQAKATDYVHQPSILAPTSWPTDNSSIDGGSTSGSQSRKRRTRWDSDTNPYLESLKHKEKSLSTVGDGKESNYEEEGPPGFSSPIDTSQVSSNGSSTPAAVDQSTEKVQYLPCPFDAVIGQPLERFKSQSPVSYGVPLLTLQQFGIPQAGSIDSWAVAPGMPFQPFPPLPPFPRDKKRRSPPSSSDCGTNSSSRDHSSADEKKPENPSPSSCSAHLADSEVPCSENQQMIPCKKLKGSSQDLGRRYFRQQKWNGAKMPPPWVRNCWRNNNPRGCSGPVLNEQRSLENAIDCKLGRDDSNYHQHMPPVQNHHH